MSAIEFTVPIRTKTGLNAREHWAAKANRVKRERNATRVAFEVALGCRYSGQGKGRAATLTAIAPQTVTLTRVGPRLADDDNAAAGLKAVRDEVAVILGHDDGSAWFTWRYVQERGPWGVRVRIEKTEPKRCPKCGEEVAA